MKKNVQGLIEHCKQAMSWLYVYGAKGKVMTKGEIQALQNIYGKSYVWDSDLQKAGNVCSDCSGLISSYTGLVRNSTSYNTSADAKLSIEDLKKNWSKYIGYGIWKQGHIGVVSEIEGYVYEMAGSAKNWQLSKLDANNWTLILKLCDIDYTGGYKDAVVESPKQEKAVQYYKKTPYTGVSIVDGLKAINVNSGIANRKKIAKANGITDYVGSATQNTKLLSLLKQGKLIKP